MTEIILGLVEVLAVIGRATCILYCVVYGYSTIDESGIFDSVKNQYLRVLLIIIAQIAVYAGILGASYYAGRYALSLIMRIIGK